MDHRFVNSFLSSVMDVIGTMTALEAKPGKPSLKADQSLPGVVTGFMAMNSPKASGALVLSFTEDAIVDIVKQLLDEELETINDTAVDTAGEITNMVTGGAKRLLQEAGFDFDMNTPEIMQSKELDHQRKFISVPIDVGKGRIYMEMSFTQH